MHMGLLRFRVTLNKTIILVTHNVHRSLRLVNRIARMKNGFSYLHDDISGFILFVSNKLENAQ